MKQHRFEKPPKIPFPDEGGTVIEKVVRPSTGQVFTKAKNTPPTGPELDLDSVRTTEEDVEERGNPLRWKTH